jgi:uncharacterized protein YraI
VRTRQNTVAWTSYEAEGVALATLPAGQQVTANGRTADSLWLRVSIPAGTGWVSAAHVDVVSGTIQALPVVQPTATPTPARTVTPTPTPTPVGARTPTPTPVAPVGQATPAATGP